MELIRYVRWQQAEDAASINTDEFFAQFSEEQLRTIIEALGESDTKRAMLAAMGDENVAAIVAATAVQFLARLVTSCAVCGRQDASIECQDGYYVCPDCGDDRDCELRDHCWD